MNTQVAQAAVANHSHTTEKTQERKRQIAARLSAKTTVILNGSSEFLFQPLKVWFTTEITDLDTVQENTGV